jgi:hypothetical protein
MLSFDCYLELVAIIRVGTLDMLFWWRIEAPVHACVRFGNGAMQVRVLVRLTSHCISVSCKARVECLLTRTGQSMLGGARIDLRMLAGTACE